MRPFFFEIAHCVAVADHSLTLAGTTMLTPSFDVEGDVSASFPHSPYHSPDISNSARRKVGVRRSDNRRTKIMEFQISCGHAGRRGQLLNDRRCQSAPQSAWMQSDAMASDALAQVNGGWLTLDRIGPVDLA
jgi:hypothetical protein